MRYIVFDCTMNIRSINFICSSDIYSDKLFDPRGLRTAKDERRRNV